MSRLRAALAFAALALGASGAAATPVCFSEPAPAAGEGRIYLYRNEAVGFMNKPPVFIDGQATGIIATPGDYYCLNRPAGTYRITLSKDDDAEVATVHLEAGKSVYVRFVVTGGLFLTSIAPVVLDASQAEGEAGYLHYGGQSPPPK